MLNKLFDCVYQDMLRMEIFWQAPTLLCMDKNSLIDIDIKLLFKIKFHFFISKYYIALSPTTPKTYIYS